MLKLVYDWGYPGRPQAGGPAMEKVTLPEDLKPLDRLAHYCIGYLVLVSLSSFFAGAALLPGAHGENLLPIALLGLAGSGIAALTSCLNRYAMGFEREDGTFFPEGLEKNAEKFNRRFSRWLFVRPLLGTVVAPVFVWGLARFVKSAEDAQRLNESLGFTAFMGGLLAKSILDLIKNLFKNIFHV